MSNVRGRIKTDKTICLEFISENSYNKSYLQTTLKDDPNVKHFIDELMAIGYPGLVKSAIQKGTAINSKKNKKAVVINSYSNPQLMDINKKIEDWTNTRRMDKSKNKGRPLGSKSQSTNKAMSLEIITLIKELKDELKDEFRDQVQELKNENADLRNIVLDQNNEISDLKSEITDMKNTLIKNDVDNKTGIDLVLDYLSTQPVIKSPTNAVVSTVTP